MLCTNLILLWICIFPDSNIITSWFQPCGVSIMWMSASDESLGKHTHIISFEWNYWFSFGLRGTRSNIRALATNSYIFRVVNFEFDVNILGGCLAFGWHIEKCRQSVSEELKKNKERKKDLTVTSLLSHCNQILYDTIISRRCFA